MPHWSPFLDGGPLLSRLYLARRRRYRLSQRVVVDCPRNCDARDMSFPRRCSGLSNDGSPGQVTLVWHQDLSASSFRATTTSTLPCREAASSSVVMRRRRRVGSEPRTAKSPFVRCPRILFVLHPTAALSLNYKAQQRVMHAAKTRRPLRTTAPARLSREKVPCLIS